MLNFRLYIQCLNTVFKYNKNLDTDKIVNNWRVVEKQLKWKLFSIKASDEYTRPFCFQLIR